MLWTHFGLNFQISPTKKFCFFYKKRQVKSLLDVFTLFPLHFTNKIIFGRTKKVLIFTDRVEKVFIFRLLSGLTCWCSSKWGSSNPHFDSTEQKLIEKSCKVNNGKLLQNYEKRDFRFKNKVFLLYDEVINQKERCNKSKSHENKFKYSETKLFVFFTQILKL